MTLGGEKKKRKRKNRKKGRRGRKRERKKGKERKGMARANRPLTGHLAAFVPLVSTAKLRDSPSTSVRV